MIVAIVLVNAVVDVDVDVAEIATIDATTVIVVRFVMIGDGFFCENFLKNNLVGAALGNDAWRTNRTGGNKTTDCCCSDENFNNFFESFLKGGDSRGGGDRDYDRSDRYDRGIELY